MNNPQPLQQQIQELQLKKDVLFEEVQLRKEIIEINQDIRDLGGDTIYNFQQNVMYIFVSTWGAISFVFGNLLTALDSTLIRFEEIERQEQIRARKRR